MAETGEAIYSFGAWVRRRRKALDLTQAALANEVGCAEVTIRKLEADAFRPSREIAERLAECLNIAAKERERFVQAARAERSVDGLPLHIDAIDHASSQPQAPALSIPVLDLAPPDSPNPAASSSGETGVIIRNGKGVHPAPRRRVLSRSRQALLTNLLCLLIGITIGMLANPLLLAYVSSPQYAAGKDRADLRSAIATAKISMVRVADFDGDGKNNVFLLKPRVGLGSMEDYIKVVHADGAQFGVLENFLCTEQAVCKVGDFNGDGMDDLVSFQRGTKADSGYGTVRVARSIGTTFESPTEWHTFFCANDEICGVGDFNGDKSDDILLFNQDTHSIQVAYSIGTDFSEAVNWPTLFCSRGQVCDIGDFNDDDKDDIVSFNQGIPPRSSEKTVKVALAEGAGFASESRWHDSLCVYPVVCGVGRFDDDGQDDIMLFKPDHESGSGCGDVSVAFSNGETFDAPIPWHVSFCVKQIGCQIGDLNGDGTDDILLKDPADATMEIAFSIGAAVCPQ